MFPSDQSLLRKQFILCFPATANHLAITGYLVGASSDILQKLGIALGIAHYRLHNIPSQSLADCLVSLWLLRVDQVDERGGPTWHTLEEAMRHSTVGMTGTANDILKERLKSKFVVFIGLIILL